jgi:hypothetical protein
MYHSLDVQRPQTVPPEKDFVQIDNTFARDNLTTMLRAEIPTQKANPLRSKKFRGTHISQLCFPMPFCSSSLI